MELADIKKVGVVGSGTMGFGIALNFALAGYPTVMSDISDEILEQSMKNIKSALALFIEYEIITQKQADDADGGRCAPRSAPQHAASHDK